MERDLLTVTSPAGTTLVVHGAEEDPLSLLLALDRAEDGLLIRVRRDHVHQLYTTLGAWLDATSWGTVR